MSYRSVSELIDGQVVMSLSPDSSVRKAAMIMAEHRIGAVLVTQEEELIGIFTEGDLRNRVIACGLGLDTTLLEQVMTKKPATITADRSLVDSMSTMSKGGFHHLPVMENDKLIGVLADRDVPTKYLRDNSPQLWMGCVFL
jgi:CBS domain-containing protein